MSCSPPMQIAKEALYFSEGLIFVVQTFSILGAGVNLPNDD